MFLIPYFFPYIRYMYILIDSGLVEDFLNVSMSEVKDYLACDTPENLLFGGIVSSESHDEF